jgi:hypothetical protein
MSHSATASRIAKASRPRQKPPNARRRQGPVAAHCALGLDALYGDAAAVGNRWRRLAAQARPQPLRHPLSNDIGLDQHSHEQQQSDEGRHRARRQLRYRIHLGLGVADPDDARHRPAFAQHLVDQDGQQRAEAGSDDAAAAAKDGGAADDTAAITMSSAFRPYWAVTPLSWKMAIRPASVAQ